MQFRLMKETRGIVILLYYTENATLKQTLKGAWPTALRVASSVTDLTNHSPCFFYFKLPLATNSVLKTQMRLIVNFFLSMLVGSRLWRSSS